MQAMWASSRNRFVCGLALAALWQASPASASDWQYVTSSTTGADVYVDRESVRTLPADGYSRPFPVQQVWVKYDFSKDKTEKDREGKDLKNFDCSGKTSLTLHSVSYAPSGKASDSHTNADYDFRYRPVTPDTLVAAVMEYACSKRTITRRLPLPWEKQDEASPNALALQEAIARQKATAQQDVVAPEVAQQEEDAR
jgi:hypothetical protein